MSLHEPNLYCSTTIEGNTDVGGPGVLGSFIFTAALTIGLAGILAVNESIEEFQKWRRQDSRQSSFISPSQRPTSTSRQFGPLPRTNSSFQAHIALPRRASQPPSNRPRPIHDGDLTGHPDEEVQESFPRVRSILGTLCDLQAITGLGLVAAGLAQWRTMTFYHEQLVVSYYVLTLNSFWAARVNYMSWDYQDAGGGFVRLLIRRLVIIASSTGGLVLQVYVYWREEVSGQWVDWSPPGRGGHRSTDGRCYRFVDRSNPLFVLVFWGSGQLIFTLALCLSLSPYTRRISERIFKNINRFTVLLQGWLQDSWKLCCRSRKSPSCTAILLVLCQRVGGALMFVVVSFLVAVWFLARQLLDVWSYGEAFYPLSWLVYFLLLIYNIWGVASLIQLNRAMVQDKELEMWGFGQVLPIALLLSIVYATMDAFSGSSRDEKVRDIESVELRQLTNSGRAE